LKRLPLQIIFFTIIRIAINTASRMVYPFLPVFARGMGVELQSVAFALSLRSAAGGAGPLLASFAESRGRWLGMMMGLLMFAGGCGLVVLYPSYLTFVAALIFTLLGNFVYLSSMQAYLGDRVPYNRRGLVLAITEVGWSLSFIIGVPIVGWLISRRGWQAPFPILFGMGLVAALGLFLLVPRSAEVSELRPSMLGNLKSVLTNPLALFALSGGVSFSLGNEAVNLVFGVWLEEAFNLQLAALGYIAAVIGFSELGGEVLVGTFVERIGKARAVTIGLVMNSVAALSLAWLGRSEIGAALGLFFFYITFEFTLVSLIPLMSEIMPKARATMLATNVSSLGLGRALGALIALPLYRWGESSDLISGILACGLMTLLFNGLSLWIFNRLKQQIAHL